jgi:hypothetical protein
MPPHPTLAEPASDAAAPGAAAAAAVPPAGAARPEDAPLLAAVSLGLEDRFGEGVTSVRVQQRIERVHSRVLFCEVRFVRRAPLAVVAKVVTGPPGDLARTAVLMRRDQAVNRHLHARFAGGDARVAVPTPLLFEPAMQLIVTELMPGTRLQDKLVAGLRGLPSRATVEALAADCAGCGRWIAAFQDACRTLLPELGADGARIDSIDLGTLPHEVQVRLEGLARAPRPPFTPEQSARIEAFVACELARVEPREAEVVGVHGDFFAGNVLSGEDGEAGTTGIDFVMFRKGLRLVDPCHFMFQLDTLSHSPGVSRRHTERLQAAFLEGFDPTLPATGFWRSRPVPRVLYVLDRLKRLLGRMPEPGAAPAPWHRRLADARTVRRATREVMDHLDACG